MRPPTPEETPMPQKLTWTEPNDLALKRARAAGLSWDEIARAFGVSRNAVIERGRKIGATRAPRAAMPAPVPDRAPLAAGHPLAWGLLTENTLLAGSAYPLPVFA
jgi:hypothetical protein